MVDSKVQKQENVGLKTCFTYLLTHFLLLSKVNKFILVLKIVDLEIQGAPKNLTYYYEAIAWFF